MKASKKIAIALVAVSSCVFGVTAKSFAKDVPPAPASANSSTGFGSVDVKGSDTNTTPAAAAAVFSSDATGNITEGAVSAAVGTTSAAATASHVNDGGTITNAAAALGSTGQIDVSQDIENGVVNLTNTTPLLGF
jgi:hypothetical protein